MAGRVLAGLRFIVRGDADTTAAKNDIAGFAESAVGYLAAVTAAAAAAQEAIEAIGASARAQADSMRALDIATGGGTPEQQRILADVVTATGFDDATVAEAILAAGPGAGVPEVAAFADLATAGADPDRLRRIAEQSDAAGADRITLFAQLRAGAAGAGIGIGEFASEFADQQTTYRNLGLDVPAQIALQQDVYRSGTPSEAQTLLEQIVDRSAAAGLDPRAAANTLFDAVRTGSRAEGLQALEAFGGANLLEPIRSGRLGLDADQLALEIPEDLNVPGSVVLSRGQQIEAASRGVLRDPDASIAERTAAAVHGLPALGSFIEALGDATGGPREAFDTRLAGTTITVVNVNGSVITRSELDELINGATATDARTPRVRFGPDG